MHFEDQAIKLKKLYYAYSARRLIIDGNGLGAGLIDYMVKSQVDPATGDSLPDFGVYNDAEGRYKQFRTNITEFDAIYIIKANAPINTEAYSQVQSQMGAGKIKFLIDDRAAQNKLLGTTKGKNMTPEERSSYLHPYRLTSILKEELLNLREETEGINIILKQANKGISKDKVSALCYGIYYIREEEENKKRRKKFSAADWSFFN